MDKKVLAQFYLNNNTLDRIKTVSITKLLPLIKDKYTQSEREKNPHIINQHLAYLWLVDRVRWDTPINFTDLQDLHFTLYRHIYEDKDNGKLRTTGKKIGTYQCPAPSRLLNLADKFDDLLLLADDIIIYGDENANLFFWYMHNVFECIQPFAYGNGRVGRFLFNILRMRHGMGINIWNVKKKNYLDAIKKFEPIFKERYLS